MNVSLNIISTIRRTLKGVAKKGGTITYRDLAQNIGKLDVRHWPELDIVWQEETDADRPDLTLVVVKADIPLPAKFNGVLMDAKDWDQETLGYITGDSTRYTTITDRRSDALCRRIGTNVTEERIWHVLYSLLSVLMIRPLAPRDRVCEEIGRPTNTSSFPRKSV